MVYCLRLYIRKKQLRDEIFFLKSILLCSVNILCNFCVQMPLLVLQNTDAGNFILSFFSFLIMTSVKKNSLSFASFSLLSTENIEIYNSGNDHIAENLYKYNYQTKQWLNCVHQHRFSDHVLVYSNVNVLIFAFVMWICCICFVVGNFRAIKQNYQISHNILQEGKKVSSSDLVFYHICQWSYKDQWMLVD